MRELDGTDMEILRLLVDDARRPYNEIAEAVGLSPPTISDRVDRLRELGVINRFTLDLDRSKLSTGVPVLVDIHARPGRADAVSAALDSVDGVEHLFRTVDEHVVFHGNFGEGEIRAVLADVADENDILEYDVRLLADASWRPQPGVVGDGAANQDEDIGFALDCAECGNTVTSEGESARIDGKLYQFCCSSCQSQFEDRYEKLAEESTT